MLLFHELYSGVPNKSEGEEVYQLYQAFMGHFFKFVIGKSSVERKYLYSKKIISVTLVLGTLEYLNQLQFYYKNVLIKICFSFSSQVKIKWITNINSNHNYPSEIFCKVHLLIQVSIVFSKLFLTLKLGVMEKYISNNILLKVVITRLFRGNFGHYTSKTSLVSEISKFKLKST